MQRRRQDDLREGIPAQRGEVSPFTTRMKLHAVCRRSIPTQAQPRPADFSCAKSTFRLSDGRLLLWRAHLAARLTCGFLDARYRWASKSNFTICGLRDRNKPSPVFVDGSEWADTTFQWLTFGAAFVAASSIWSTIISTSQIVGSFATIHDHQPRFLPLLQHALVCK